MPGVPNKHIAHYTTNGKHESFGTHILSYLVQSILWFS
jgi:hypothetical protein